MRLLSKILAGLTVCYRKETAAHCIKLRSARRRNKRPLRFDRRGRCSLEIKEALIKSTCADLRQKFLLTRKKIAEILTDFKIF